MSSGYGLKYFPSLLDLIRLTFGPISQCSLLAFSKFDYWTYELHTCLASHIFKGGWGGVRSFYYSYYFIIRVTLLDPFVKCDLRSFYKGDLDSAWDNKIAMTKFGDTFETRASLPWAKKKNILRWTHASLVWSLSWNDFVVLSFEPGLIFFFLTCHSGELDHSSNGTFVGNTFISLTSESTPYW